MDDLITLSCPSCGGQLRIESNTTNFTCYYCGQQHRLRIEDVEAFGRCPICRRNDKVEKVKAIRHKKDSLAARLAPPKDPERTFVYQPKQKPEPLKKTILNEEKTKSRYTKRAQIILPLSVGLLILFVYLISQDSSRFYPAWFFLLGLIGLVLSIVYFIGGKIDEKKLNKKLQEQLINDWQSQNEKQLNEWTDYIQQYDNDFHQKSAMMKGKYAKAMQRYDQLYYCHRDDCVFIPGESGYAPSAKIDEFLFTDPQENKTGQ
jgi:predicted RNA-binding Zn-ribbon protein involved in translation (DUF1610 family)